MAKITLPSVVSINNVSTINSNFQDIASELDDKVLYRDNPEGEANQMETSLDMNSNRILNLPKPISSLEPVRRIDIVDTSTVSSEIIEQAVSDSVAAATAAQIARIGAEASATEASGYAQDAYNNSRLTVGTVITGAAGTNAAVAINGAPGSQIIDFTIPRGEPGGGGSDSVLRIVVLGDSMTARQSMLDEVWPDTLESNLNAAGSNVKVFNLAVNGATYRSAMTDPIYGGLSQVQRCIAYAPDLVIVALGINDGYRAASVGTHAIISDATNLYNTLAAALPSAKLVYASETFYDKVHGSPATLTNEQTFPIFANPRTSGILFGTYCPEIMPEASSVSHRASVTAWQAMDTAIKALGHPYFELPLWQAVRLGLSQSDAFHINYHGHKFVSSAAFRWCQSYTALFPNVGIQGVNAWNDWQSAFNQLLISDGVRFVNKTPSGSDAGAVSYWGPWNTAIRESWYSQAKSTVHYDLYQGTYVKRQNVWRFMVLGALPGTEVSQSSNEGDWQVLGKVDSRGVFCYSILFDGLDVPNGTYTQRVKVGADVHPKVTFTVSGSPYVSPDNVPLSGLTGGGAAFGQVPIWNGAAWVPGSAGGGGVKAYVVADGDMGFSSLAPTALVPMALSGSSGGGMTTIGGTYLTGAIVPRTGRYMFTARGMCVSSGSVATWVPRALVNDTVQHDFGTYNNKSGAVLTGFNCTSVLSLNAGDSVKAIANVDVSTVLTPNTSVDKWWSWSLVEL